MRKNHKRSAGMKKSSKKVVRAFLDDGIKINLHNKIYGIIVDETSDREMNVIGFVSKPVKMVSGCQLSHPLGGKNYHIESVCDIGEEMEQYFLDRGVAEEMTFSDIEEFYDLRDPYDLIPRLETALDTGIISIMKEMTLIIVSAMEKGK